MGGRVCRARAIFFASRVTEGILGPYFRCLPEQMCNLEIPRSTANFWPWHTYPTNRGLHNYIVGIFGPGPGPVQQFSAIAHKLIFSETIVLLTMNLHTWLPMQPRACNQNVFRRIRCH